MQLDFKKSVLDKTQLTRYLVMSLMAFLLVGCSDPLTDKILQENLDLKKERDELETKVAQLTQQNEALTLAPERLLGIGMDLMNKKHYQKAIGVFNKLGQYHPDSKEYAKVKPLIKKAEAGIKQLEKDKVAKAKADAAAKKKRIANATRRMKKQHDAMNQVTFYQDKSSRDGSRSTIYLYITQNDVTKSKSYRLLTRYYGDDWLFVKHIKVLADGKRFDSFGTYKRDHSGGSVWEWSDKDPSKGDMEMLKTIAHSKKAVVRFEGDKYYREFTVSKKEKQAILNVMDAYEAMD